MQLLTSVDLSHPLVSGMPVYPGDPKVHFEGATDIASDGFNVMHVRMGSQSGTHIDAPFHFLSSGARIDEYPTKRFVGPATLMSASGLAPHTRMTADMVPPPRVPESLLIIHTGWSTHWGRDSYFSHPFLDASAAEAIVQAGYTVVAIDALSVDQTDGGAGDFSAHMVLLGAGIPIAENLTNVPSITWEDPWLSVLPLHIQGADGAPVRAVALQFGHD